MGLGFFFTEGGGEAATIPSIHIHTDQQIYSPPVIGGRIEATRRLLEITPAWLKTSHETLQSGIQFSIYLHPKEYPTPCSITTAP